MNEANSPKNPKVDTLLRRMLFRFGVWLVLSIAILYEVVVWWCASEIAEPSRRLMDPASRAYFDGTSKAGFTLEEFKTSDEMPCLVCIPQQTPLLSKKAKIIRGQIAAKGMELKPPGQIIGTLMILHGRAEMKEDYLAVAERFCAVGFRCVIPDLPGHGSNPKRFTTYGVLEAPTILRCYE